MKLIIDIPEDALKEMKTEEFISIESLDTAIECIKNGTPFDSIIEDIKKESYEQGYKDGQEALVAHLKLCKEELLDKIKDEIDQKQYDFMADGDYNEGIRFGLMLAYQIIDKYKAESEDKE